MGEKSVELKHIAFCINNGVIVDLIVCLESLFATNPHSFSIHILHEGKIQKNLIEQTCQKYNQQVEFKELTAKKFLKLRSYQGNLVTYFRLLLPDVVPVTKILYLDADISINGDISSLWDMDMTKYALAAVPDWNPSLEHTKKIGVAHNSYFNAGVLFLNLAYIKKHKLFEKTFEHLEKNTAVNMYADQDGLNVVFENKYLKLPQKFNYGFQYRPGFQSLKNPLIIHYYGMIKPKIWYSAHPLSKTWWKYLRQSSCSDYKNKPTLETFHLWFAVRIWAVLQKLGLSSVIEMIRKKK